MLALNMTFGVKAVIYQAFVNSMTLEFIKNYSESFSSLSLLQTEVYWAFYGWCLLFDWITGFRAIVQFQDDEASITAITFHGPLLAFAADPTEIPTTIYTFTLKRSIEGMNLFELNRIVGHSWAGRTILTVRSITAILILNTAPIYLNFKQMTPPQLPAYQTILAATEVTWLVYVLNDIFSFTTRQYTSYYALKSLISTWFIIAIWTLLSLLEITLKLKRLCDYIDMDYTLVWSSAEVAIGTFLVLSKVFWLLWCVSFFVMLWNDLYFQNNRNLEVRTHLLNSHSLHMLDFTNWKFDGVYYIDKASAIMAGLISWSYSGKLYILDTKSWRVFSLPIVKLTTSSSNLHSLDRFQKAIQLEHH
ncbi:hypothetical protein THRCLA_23449 [Thraustotheca clavata]|uniref:Uncharacterized protein n=1 Tax=Thraustotheca clavata TaxID=74557 RepID=A0A1V9Y4I7_9STRA|nr:hypothetical protein THRCLA_23449 [Thraustotheca clavata]